MNEPGRCRTEAARVEVERLEAVPEVDMEPVTPGGLRMLRREQNGARPDPLALIRAVRFRIEQEGVVSAIGHNVGEPDENAVADASSYPAETVRSYPIPPPRRSLAAVRVHQLDHLRVRQRAAPAIGSAVQFDHGFYIGHGQQMVAGHTGPAAETGELPIDAPPATSARAAVRKG